MRAQSVDPAIPAFRQAGQSPLWAVWHAIRPEPGEERWLFRAKVSVWLHWLAACTSIIALFIPPTGLSLAARVLPLVAIALAATGPIRWFPWRRVPDRLFVLVTWLDLGLVGLGVGITGGLSSRYQWLYVLIVMFAAYFYETADVALVTCAVIAVYCLPFVYTAHPSSGTAPSAFVFVGVLLVVAGVTKATSVLLERERERRDAAESQLNSLYALELERSRALQQKTRQLESILETGNAFRLQMGLDGLLSKIAEAICDTGGFRAAVVRLFDPQTGEAVCRAVHGVDWQVMEPPTPPEFIQRLLDPKFRVSRSYLVEITSDMWQDPNTKPFLYVRPGGDHLGGEWKADSDALIVPLETREHGLIGIISVDEPLDGRIPTLDTIQALEIFANLAATAIDNARLLEEASQAQALRELDKLKSEFLAMISHDLRTPITVIKGSVDLLGDSHLDAMTPVQRKLIANVQRNSDRLAAMVNQLLDMVQIEEGRVQLHRQQTDISALARDTAESLTLVASGRGQTISVDAPVHGPILLVDRQRIQQIMANLIGNASKYGPEDGRITVRVSRRAKEVRVSVRDEGGGISASEQKRIFDKFYRTDSQRSSREGTGLGLAICQSLVELHSGRIWVDSRPGAGTTFTFSLPVDGEAI